MENKQLCSISVDVQIQPDGKYDVWIAEDGSSGAHYTVATADEIGKRVADMVQCFAEAAEQ